LAQASSQRKLAAILIGDAVGFSRLTGQNEEVALELLKARQVIFAREIGEHQGRIFGGAGDSVVAEFASAVEALRCAVACQSQIVTLNEGAQLKGRLSFRIGINIGDVLVEEGNLFGDGVNVAERLQSIAEPDGICVSASVHDQIRGKLPVALEDLGLKALKNIPYEVHCYRIAADGLPARASVGKPVSWLVPQFPACLAREPFLRLGQSLGPSRSPGCSQQWLGARSPQNRSRWT
jgi:adenylate cyclase